MNFLRRVYLLLVSLLLVIIVLSLFLSPETVVIWVGRVSELAPIIRVLLAVVLSLMLLALIYVQIRPDPRTNMTGLMMRGSGAVTEVSIESARDRILNAVNAVPDVVSAEAQVKPVNGKADIEMQVVVLGGDVKLPVKQKEINRALKQVIDKQLGLRMAGQPRIHIRLQDQFTPKPVVTPLPVTLPPAKEEPVISTPVPPPTVEPEEPEPEVKSGGGLFDRWRIGGKEEAEDATVRLPEKSLPPSDEPYQAPLVSTDASSSPRTGDEHKEVEFSTPSLSSLLSETESSEQSSANLDIPAKPVIITIDDEKTLKLDLDEELAHSAIDDFGDDDIDEADQETDTGEAPKSDSDEIGEDRSPLA